MIAAHPTHLFVYPGHLLKLILALGACSKILGHLVEKLHFSSLCLRHMLEIPRHRVEKNVEKNYFWSGRPDLTPGRWGCPV
jgi:hypothetical protein